MKESKVRRRSPAIPKFSSARRVALLIGNAGIRNSSGKGFALKNPGTHRDVDGMAAVLGDPECGGFKITQLKDPTLISARRELVRVTRDLNPQDTILIYYSGGSARDAEQRLYLPVGDSDKDFLRATCIDSDYILACLRLCQSQSQILIIDGCYSGCFFNGNRGIPDGFSAITSCGANESSWGDDEGGLFTRFMIDGLKGAAAAGEGSNVVTAQALYRYVTARATRHEYATTPQYWSWNLAEPIPLTRLRRKLFLSYSRADARKAEKIVSELEKAGYGVFVDRNDIPGGDQWRKQIDSALRAADAVVFVLSKDSLRSDEVYRELKQAVTLQRPIIPVRIDQAALVGWYAETIKPLQHVDATGGLDTCAERLLAALKHSTLSRKPAKQPVVKQSRAAKRQSIRPARKVVKVPKRRSSASVVRIPQWADGRSTIKN